MRIPVLEGNLIKIMLLVALLLGIVTAIFSHGAYHADEHFQILEFASLKLGYSTVDQLPWEYSAHIRPTFQPFIALCWVKAMEFFGLSDSFLQLQLLRVFTFLLGFWAIFNLTQQLKSEIDKSYHNLLYALSYFLYFVPLLLVRFSSENFSAIFLIFGLASLMKVLRDDNRHPISYLYLGGLFGLSFLSRFQIAFMLLGLFSWLIFIKKESLKSLVYMFLGIALVVMLGGFIDYYFYNMWVFTPWEYFESNIIKDIASGFGTSPWHHYFKMAIDLNWVYVINIVLIISVILFITVNPKHLLTFLLVPFLLIHFIIPHKELRFIFPMLVFIPFILTSSVMFIKTQIDKIGGSLRRIVQFMALSFLLFLVVVNIMVLLTNAIKPLDKHPQTYQKLVNMGVDHNVYYLIEPWGFNSWEYFRVNYYNKGAFKVEGVQFDSLKNLPKGALVITADDTPVPDSILNNRIRPFPNWLFELNKNNRLNIGDRNWVIYSKQ